MGLGHEGRGALVAGRHDPDPDIAERIEQAEERFAGHGERVPDAGSTQGGRDVSTDRDRAGRDLRGRRVRRRPRRAVRQRGRVVGGGLGLGGASRPRSGARPPASVSGASGGLGLGSSTWPASGGASSSGSSAWSASSVVMSSAIGRAIVDSTRPTTITIVTATMTALATRAPDIVPYR